MRPSLLLGSSLGLVTTLLASRGALAQTATATPSSPQAESRSLVDFDLEAFAARGIDPYNSSLFGFGGGGALHVEGNIVPVLSVHVGAELMFFSRDQSPNGTTWFGGQAGLRFHWGALLGWPSSDGWIDVHGDFGQSGQILRPGFDVGAGLALSPVKGFRVGPFVRFHWQSDPRGENPMWLTFGLTFGVLGDPRTVPPPPPDTDHDRDGVQDTDDVCPMEPMGAHPDAARRGCPARDTDGDSVFDNDDQCVTTPQGARPDPARPGCPLTDGDNDGVADSTDQCPTVPAGAHPDPNRPGCPATDTDADGKYDYEDQCPTVPAGARPDPERGGCPIPDRDNDTVPDAQDHCPDQAGAPSQDAEHNGCPGLVRIEQQQIRILRPVFFASARDVILDESFPVLAAVADAMQASGIQHIRVEGHTDDRGNDHRNLVLSQRRADSVKRWLVEHGISADRIDSQGLGETHPIEPNTTSLGRAANRRVEFHILDTQ